MNSILEKAVAELQKDNPNIDYIRGMLETALAMGGSSVVEQPMSNRKTPGSIPSPAVVNTDILVNVDMIKKIAEESKK